MTTRITLRSVGKTNCLLTLYLKLDLQTNRFLGIALSDFQLDLIDYKNILVSSNVLEPKNAQYKKMMAIKNNEAVL